MSGLRNAVIAAGDEIREERATFDQCVNILIRHLQPFEAAAQNVVDCRDSQRLPDKHFDLDVAVDDLARVLK